MIGWLILAAYVLGYAAFLPVTVKFLYDDITSGSGDTGDRITAIALGMLVSLFWPLYIPGAWIYKRLWGAKS